ncbi:hypothetical protein CR513_00511, partial [Mucuna pruriens]
MKQRLFKSSVSKGWMFDDRRRRSDDILIAYEIGAIAGDTRSVFLIRMTRKRSFDSLYPFDPKIDKTLNKIRKFKNMHVGHSSGSFSSIFETDNFEIKHDISNNPLYKPDPMENNNRTLMELATPDLELTQSYKLKSGLVYLFPKFHGLAGEDPHKHLKEFHMVCSTMRPEGILEDYIKMKVFSFSLDGVARSTVVSTNSSPNFSSNSDNSVSVANNIDFSSYSSSNSNTYSNLDLTDSNKPELMENQDRTLKELATADVVYQPWCIEYPQLEPTQSYELKSGEDPHKHLKEFHVGILEDYIKIKAFLFSLDGVAKDWVYLQQAFFNTWGDMKHTFLEKFFSVSRTATIRKAICGIWQHVGETLHEYWERFNRLCATCPHHQISLMMMDCSMIDVASGGALMDKTSTIARHLILNMASNTQGAITNRVVNEVGVVDNVRLENQLTELTSLVRQLTISQHQQIPPLKICGICTFMEHPTNMCPTLQETESGNAEIVGAIGGNQYGRQSYQTRQFDGQQFGRPQQYRSSPIRLRYPTPLFQQQQQQIPTQNNSPSMEEWMKFQQNMNATMHDLKLQIGQLASSVSQIQMAGSGNLPSQTIPNPKGGNVSTIMLRSGKELQVALRPKPNPTDTESEPKANSRTRITPLLFPSQSLSTRKPEIDEDLLKMFRRVEINIPLLDAIKQFLKELCIHKRKKLKARAEVEGVLSVFIQKEVTARTQPAPPRKCRDLGIFSVPCTIGDCTFANAMLDLGASINVMPASIYKSLNFGDLEPIGVRCITHGYLEDVLVEVNELIFPTNFYVLDMEYEMSRKGSTLILGRPFLMTARTKIDLYAETLSMEFGDNLV